MEVITGRAMEVTEGRMTEVIKEDRESKVTGRGDMKVMGAETDMIDILWASSEDVLAYELIVLVAKS
jgi:hypothetical protein